MYEGDQSNLEAPPPEESSNRTFLIVAGILGGIVLLTIACFAVYALFIAPGQQKNQQQALAAQSTQNAQVQQALTSTAQALSLPTETLTPSPTFTPVVAVASATNTPSTTNTPDPSTATVAAALTQAAQAQLTVVPTSTALPGTGFADQYGAPGLVVMGMVLIAVIFLARRLRTPTAS